MEPRSGCGRGRRLCVSWRAARRHRAGKYRSNQYPALRDGAGSAAHGIDGQFTVLQLVDIAVRALSADINDPHTAIRVIDRLGAALCMLVTRRMLTGVVAREGRVVLQRDATSYDGMTDSMFHVIRQNATTSPAVLIRMLEVLTVAAECERREDRLATLERHASLVLADALRSIPNEEDRKTVQGRADRFSSVVASRHLALVGQKDMV